MFKVLGQKGVSLVELLVVVVVLGVLLGGMYNTFQAQEHSSVVQERVAEMNQNARVALEIMSRDIRNAAYDPERYDPSSSAYGWGAGARIWTATDTSIVYTVDWLDSADCTDESLASDGAIGCPGEWGGFRFDAAQKVLEKCFGSTSCSAADWYDFVDNIQSLQFTYIYTDGESSATVGLPNDADADDTNDLDDVREVEIEVIAQRMAGFGEGSTSKILRSRVQVRNLALS
jgi:type IV pilus assembly protein PilW